MAAFPTTVATDSDLYIAVNATSTQLTDNPLTAGATTVNVVSASLFPTVGFISIDNEIIKYTGKTATSFTGCTRGADGTSATSHVQNSQVFHNVIAGHHNALKDDLIATEQFISDVIGRTNTQIRTPAGSAAVPSHSFAGDTDTGLFNLGDNAIRVSIGGTQRYIFDNGDLTSSSDTAKVSLVRTSNGRTAYIQVTNTFGGMRYHAGPNGGSELANIAHQWTTDAPTAGTVWMTMLGGGDVGIGDVSPAEKLLITGDAGKSLLRLRSTNTTTNTITGLKIETGIASGTIGATPFIHLQDGGSDVLKVVGAAGLIQAKDGSAGTPVYSFLNDSDCGFYRSGTNEVSVSTNSTQRFAFTALGSFQSVGGADIKTGDGIVSAPGYTFSNDQDTGFMRGATGRIDVVGDGVISAFHRPVGTSHGVQYSPFQVRGGGGGNGGLSSFENFTQSVGTSALNIWNSTFGDGNLIIVHGKDGSAQFTDILVSTFSTISPTVVVSHSTGGAVARTYAQAIAGAITLQMASSTYSVHAFGFAVTTAA